MTIVCTMPDAAVLCALPTRLFGSKIVLDIHDTMPELYQDKFGGRRGAIAARLLMQEERISASFADTVLAVHAPHRVRLIKAGVPPTRSRTVMNSPPTRPSSPPCRARATHRRCFHLACHGTVTHRLGLDIAIEAVALARARVPGLHLMVIGAGDHLEARQPSGAKASRGMREFHRSGSHPRATASAGQG